MENRKLPALLALVGVLVAVVVLLFVLQEDTGDQDTEPGTPAGGVATTGDDDKKPADKPKPEPKPEVATIEVKGGEPVGGVSDLEFTEGERIQIKVVSDAAGEVHLHGYDVTLDVTATEPVEFDLKADIGGVFELELEETAAPLAEVSVVPS